MSKKPQVTRTIPTTKVVLLVADTVAAEFHNTEVNLPRTYKDDDAIIKAARPLVETAPHLKVVSVSHVEVIEQLYGMPETEFLKYAKVLPPRGTKAESEENPVNEDEGDADAE